MEKLYNNISNTEYLKFKVMDNIKKNGYSNNYLGEKFISILAIEKISNCIVDFIEGDYVLEKVTGYNEISHIIINNMLKYIQVQGIEKLNIGFIIKIFKCYRNSYIDVVLEEGCNNKVKLKITNYIERFFDELEIVACGRGLSSSKVKKTEDALIESENRYKKLLEVMPDAVYVNDNGKIVYTNKAGAKLMGYLEPKEILGKSSYELLEIDDYNKILIKQQEDITMRSGYLPPVERKYFRKSDGKFLEVETTSTVISYEEEKTILNITRDISERKRIEFLKQKVRQKTFLLNKTIEYNKLRTEFFANISHELRTPLNMILGTIQLVNITNNDKTLISPNIKVEKYMSIIKQNSYRLLKLVDNLIDITKIDAGYLDISLQNDDIVKVVEDIALSVVEYVESKGLELIFDTDIEEKYMAFDADKIERIMLNLISNAIKFTKRCGRIYVNIYDKQDTIVIAVRDTGIGIPLEKQKEIFERFSQVDKSLSRKQEGSGIGLSLVKSLVEMHKGKIYINKKITKGSEFIIELPVKVLDSIKESNENYNAAENYIERSKIEFSDIYS
ncbi:PAS domain-containing sensor histidine kinase [Clostridium sp. FP2]|uniref:PAS domain-containing sensor histidine kinase n=1 Tax=Clostridium TaxID=1485 RepID=UPI0013E96134|nr:MULTISPECIES: PAS domain-containing sensor histidine kinase [Clostridium]MBW9158369.1 PAS domain-containing sensor histidine kinase [Clostridium tagluense]MBZ9621508.1 PAS domain-containing sensor histidine kinase [Clostridium sp. FP2]WLC65866.1 PAS domain-containing sensor histidine kinase [Clostridium tagluense]